ncbi:MAG: molecular chaperone HtpG, partial [Frisingicoccus sp.]|nr:molecular chaperone HtpG [Frisingicoccus sp.]
QPFISILEQDEKDVQFHRIDTDLADVFKEEVGEEDSKALEENTKTLTEVFKKALGREELEVKVEKLKNPATSSMITLKEESRRMQDMMKMYGMTDMSMFGNEGETLILNANNTLVQYVLANTEGEYTDMICQQLYDLALLSHKPLDAAAMTKFIERSNKILEVLTK